MRWPHSESLARSQPRSATPATSSRPAKLDLEGNSSYSSNVYFAEDALQGQNANTETNCVVIGYTSTNDESSADLRLYGSNEGLDPQDPEAPEEDLANYIELTITAGTAENQACDGWQDAESDPVVFEGTLREFQELTDYASGIELETFASSGTVAYKFDTALDANAPDSIQGKDAGEQTFTWEIQATPAL